MYLQYRIYGKKCKCLCQWSVKRQEGRRQNASNAV
uniref:Uncharacterized protein n=1 Tax=Siphoviridae sp. ctGyV19 TaxID=2826225 RepID=A0A8S5MUX1_9CAUD|nr:MAG TPA: hypothetical protein [Siphoviridae sp. ctGyV19]